MAGAAEGNGAAAGGDEGGDARAAGEDEGKGAGPEGIGEFFGGVGPMGGAGAGGGDVVRVNDKRIAGGAALGFVDFLDGGIRAGVGAQAVDGFGGKGDEVVGEQQLGCLLDCSGVGNTRYWP